MAPTTGDYQSGIGGGGFNFNAGLMQAAKVYQQSGLAQKWAAGNYTLSQVRKNLKKGAKLGGTTRAATSITKESDNHDLLAEFGFKGASE